MWCRGDGSVVCGSATLGSAAVTMISHARRYELGSRRFSLFLAVPLINREMQWKRVFKGGFPFLRGGFDFFLNLRGAVGVGADGLRWGVSLEFVKARGTNTDVQRNGFFPLLSRSVLRYNENAS